MDDTTQKILHDSIVSAARGTIQSKNDAINLLNQGVSQANERVNNLSEKLSSYQFQTIHLQDEVNSLREQLTAEKAKLLTAQKANNLLSMPLVEIAKANADFRSNYDIDMLNLADWVVSQKSFKELAINFGEKLGIDKNEVVRQGLEGELNVLSCTNDKTHKTNANDSTWLESKIPHLVMKVVKERGVKESEILKNMSIHKKKIEQGILLGLEKDFERDIDFFEYCNNSNQNNDSRAQYNLAICYKYGIGTDESRRLYEMTLQRAVEIGSGEACYLRYCDLEHFEYWAESSYVNFGPESIQGQQKENISLLFKAAELGCHSAIDRLEDLKKRREKSIAEENVQQG